LGGVGAAFAYCLEKTGRARVTAVARSNYELYTTTGVDLENATLGKIVGWKPYKVVKSQEEAFTPTTSYTFCLLTTKCLPDVQPNSALLDVCLNHAEQIGAFVLVQNGLEVERDLYEEVVKRGLDTPILSGAVWIGVMSSADGRKIAWGAPIGLGVCAAGIYPPPAIASKGGPSPSKAEKALKLWDEVLSEGGMNSVMVERIDSVRFLKNIWNCVWSSVESLSRATPDNFADLPPDLQDQIKILIREVVITGFKSGLLKEGQEEYPYGGKMGDAEQVAKGAWDKIIGMSIGKRKAGQAPHKMSMYIDVEMNRPFEVEVITGAVARVAKENNIPTPLLDYTYALLKVTQGRILRDRQLAGSKPAL